ncbi:MAG: metallophosphoesterase [Terracidiphilus sp.]|jgi:hypothetical protein
MATNGFAFANPHYTADNFVTYSAAQIKADAGVPMSETIQEVEAIPPLRVNPPVMDLGSVLPSSALDAITAAGKLVFHSVGDTGGIVKAEPQLAVADAMAAELGGKSYATGLPAFFYHLGDVVYFFGQGTYYPEQFYEPYRNYAAPIFAIPGNHDGEMYKGDPVPYSLQPFVDNFCAASPQAGVPGFSRTTMTQPGVYFTLTAPFARIIGLYSNTGESSGVLGDSNIGTGQITYLEQQLAAALAARQADPEGLKPQALIIAVHHPPFTGSSAHLPSAAMLKQIDQCCTQAKIWPDMVLSGHAHLYERYTRTMKADGRQIPYLVAGNGGYYDLPGLKTKADGTKPTAGEHSEPDGQGNTITLDQYNDTQYGYLRITVSKAAIQVQALTASLATPVPPATSPAVTQIDSFTLNLTTHTVTTP